MPAVNPAAGRRTPSQPQHRGQSLRGARSARRHRDASGQGMLPPVCPVAAAEGRSTEGARRDTRRVSDPGTPPAPLAQRLSAHCRRTLRRAREPAGTRRCWRRRMKTADSPAIEIRNLVRRYGRADAVNGLSLTVAPGRCYGFFGRNGAGKTTTIKCLLNLLRPSSGQISIFGMDPARQDVGVKSRLAYVPDVVGFYPWMTVQQTLDYFASFRARWNAETEQALLSQFQLDRHQKTSHLSKGQRTQLALISAICAEPDLLVLDEPTSGLDPIVRREFIRTVIGAYQEADPNRRTVFVSTHLIAEFEGLIDEFTIIEHGREMLTLDADMARERYQKV